MKILLLTDQVDRESVLPALNLICRAVRYGPLNVPTRWFPDGIDAVIVDGRSNPAGARKACRDVSEAAPQVAVVAVLSPEDFVVVDEDWCIDDVVLSSCGSAELHVRLRLSISRRRRAVEDTLQFGDLVIHPESYSASLGSHQLNLTLTEFKLLNYLVSNAGRALTRTRLMHEVWGHECSRRTVDVHVQRLRAKLGHDYESIIDTVRGVGYMAHAGPQPTTEHTPIAVGQ